MAVFIIKHTEVEGPGNIEKFLRNNKITYKVIELSKGEVLPYDFDDIKAIISLGGAMNVYEEDKYHFLREENAFIKEALRKEIPFLGVCLGAQMLAKACGARVKKAPKEELGWFEVDLTEMAVSDPLFKNIPDKFPVFQWHEDTFDIPDNGVLLATSDPCKNQAMRVGKCAWGLQFHPEITSTMLEAWFDYYQVNFVKDNLLSGYAGAKEMYERQARALYHNFLHLPGANVGANPQITAPYQALSK